MTKTFTSVSNNSSWILVTQSCVTDDEIYTKKDSVGPSKNYDRKEVGKRKKDGQLQSQAFCITCKHKSSHRYMQCSLYYFSNCLKHLLLGLLERPKCQNIHFFGTSNSVDRHGGSFTTSDISSHLTGTWSRLEVC